MLSHQRKPSRVESVLPPPVLCEGVPFLHSVLIANESENVYTVLISGEEVQQIVNGTKKACSIVLDKDCLSLHLKRKLKDVVVDIAQLREVRAGFLTQGLLLAREKLNLQEDHVLSLIVSDPKDERKKPICYDLHFENQLMREWWLNALQTLLRAMSDWNGEAYVFLKPWLTHLKGKETMSARTALKLLRELKFNCSRQDVQSMLNRFDVDKDGRLNFSGTKRT